MAIDWSAIEAAGGFGKGTPRAISKATRVKADAEALKDAYETLACKRCGAAFTAKRRLRRQFCSQPCSFAWRFENNQRRKACAVCGKPIMVPKMAREQRTCSKRCGYELRKSKTRNQRACKHCQAMFWPVRQSRGGLEAYCSRRCYYEAHKPTMATVQCVQCSGSIRRRSFKFRWAVAVCSRECQAAYFSGVNHPLYRGGSDPNRGPRWRKLAAQIRKRDDYECQRCGKTQQEDGKALAVDHIVPWRLFQNKDEANHPDNLASLCIACHAHKTAYVEPRYLRGDMMAFAKYKAALFISRERRSQRRQED